jgi:hypothetical protein
MTGYVFANVEIPAYTSLIAVAEAADHGETKRVDDPCIAMARWLLVRLPDVTKSYLPRAASRNRSVVHPFRFASSGQALSVASAGYPRFALRVIPLTVPDPAAVPRSASDPFAIAETLHREHTIGARCIALLSAVDDAQRASQRWHLPVPKRRVGRFWASKAWMAPIRFSGLNAPVTASAGRRANGPRSHPDASR